MKKSINISLAIIFLFSACKSEDSTKKIPPTVTLASSYTVDDGRLLASSCYGCHGTNGYSQTSWDSIAKEDELYEEMHEKAGIMGVQTNGFTIDEINKMQSFLSSLAKSSDD